MSSRTTPSQWLSLVEYWGQAVPAVRPSYDCSPSLGLLISLASPIQSPFLPSVLFQMSDLPRPLKALHTCSCLVSLYYLYAFPPVNLVDIYFCHIVYFLEDLN